ncbi:hypothetical protein KR51_00021470 [Rubidibacter lacunae KORDI 51-2]|uniref:Uncharacterized protein n=1 Tax=Rubidibacter lacunae KORDI 51-2 TaxID=582515 RepID=U5D9J0_9CHRO|nr:hypothetical protein [Rubidibacter lacunae]ERN41258.1 hypothetical protein KR51_00021470 [Rubidibacter lacunae KORDI 51-2]
MVVAVGVVKMAATRILTVPGAVGECDRFGCRARVRRHWSGGRRSLWTTDVRLVRCESVGTTGQPCQQAGRSRRSALNR